jgi:hypothetical protein
MHGGCSRAYDWVFMTNSFLHTSLISVLLFQAEVQLPPHAQSLSDAYPDRFTYHADSNEIVWKDGTRMAFGAERPGLSLDERMASTTLWDQLSMPYPREWPQTPPAPDADPGRLRCDALFKKVYGATADEVERNLVRVAWPAAGAAKTVRFSRVNGASTALEAVSIEIGKLPSDVRRYVARPNGTFNWRVIEGTDRLSPHSYGIAIDFDLPGIPNQYWRWSPPAKGEATPAPPSASNYPHAILKNDALRQIVEVFEAHGFIWGGKWHHYDIMHFEYRPELAGKAK